VIILEYWFIYAFKEEFVNANGIILYRLENVII